MVMGFGSKALQAYSGGAVKVNQLLGYATVMFPSVVEHVLLSGAGVAGIGVQIQRDARSFLPVAPVPGTACLLR